MNFLELVKNRYSCGAYKPLNVEREKLDYILECVRYAPSAVNKQPWHFHIVTKDDDKAQLQQCYNRDWLKTAPMYVIASILHDEEWVRADGKHHGDIDIAIAVEHLCLAATIGGTPHLDGQYTVFGEVEEGLDVVELIQGSATGRGDRPIDDIEMRISVID